MRGRSTKKAKLSFDDSHLPANDLTAERIEEIEKTAAPLLKEMLAKLRIEKPHLFTPASK